MGDQRQGYGPAHAARSSNRDGADTGLRIITVANPFTAGAGGPSPVGFVMPGFTLPMSPGGWTGGAVGSVLSSTPPTTPSTSGYAMTPMWSPFMMPAYNGVPPQGFVNPQWQQSPLHTQPPAHTGSNMSSGWNTPASGAGTGALAVPAGINPAKTWSALAAPTPTAVRTTRMQLRIDSDAPTQIHTNPLAAGALASPKTPATPSRRSRSPFRDHTAWDDGTWRPPDKALAKKLRARSHPRRFATASAIADGSSAETDDFGSHYGVCSTRTGRFCCRSFTGFLTLDVLCEGTDSELSVLGPGISAYFKLQRAYTWIFLVMAILALPMLTVFMSGTATSRAGASSGLAVTTVGRIGTYANASFVTFPSISCSVFRAVNATVTPPPSGSAGSSAAAGSCNVTKEAAVVVLSLLDCVGIVLMLAMHVWVQCAIPVEERDVTQNTATLERYTVQVPHPPQCVTEEGLIEHFYNVTRFRPVQVYIAKDETGIIRLLQQRGALVRVLERLNDRVARFRSEGKEASAKALQPKQREVTRKILALRQKQANLPPGRGILCAFVTFDQEEGRLAALEAYPPNSVKFWCQSDRLRYGNAATGELHRLRVRSAPPPSLILWENLAATWWQRTARRVGTLLISGALLGISTVISYITSREAKSAQVTNDVSRCPAGLTQSSAAGDDTLTNCWCASSSYAKAATVPMCGAWVQQRTIATLAQYTTAILVVAINVLLTWLMRRLTQWELHQSVDTQHSSLAHRLFVVMFINTGLLTLLVYTALPNLPAAGVQYGDFDYDWYFAVGNSILVSMALNIAMPHVPSVLQFLYIACMRRRTKPSTAPSQRDLNDLWRGPEFELSQRYATIMNTIAVTLLYSAGMPVLLMLACGAFFVSFWVDKWLLLRFYRTPPSFSTKLGAQMQQLVPFMTLAHLGMAMWMWSSPDVFGWASLGQLSASAAGALSSDQNTYTSGGVASVQAVLARRVLAYASLPPLVLFLCVCVAWLLHTFFSVLLAVAFAMVPYLTCGLLSSPSSASVACSWWMCRSATAPAPRFTEVRFRQDKDGLQGLPSYNPLDNDRMYEQFGLRVDSAPPDGMTLDAIVQQALPLQTHGQDQATIIVSTRNLLA